MTTRQWEFVSSHRRDSTASPIERSRSLVSVRDDDGGGGVLFGLVDELDRSTS